MNAAKPLTSCPVCAFLELPADHEPVSDHECPRADAPADATRGYLRTFPPRKAA